MQRLTFGLLVLFYIACSPERYLSTMTTKALCVTKSSRGILTIQSGYLQVLIFSLELESNSRIPLESRDLIQKILQRDPAKRLTIHQILSHAWFVPRPQSAASHLSPPAHDVSPPHSPEPFESPPGAGLEQNIEISLTSGASNSSSTAFAPTEFDSSTSTTLGVAIHDTSTPNGVSAHVSTGDATVAKGDIHEGPRIQVSQSNAEKSGPNFVPPLDTSVGGHVSDVSHLISPTSGSKPPPPHSVRTPVRTKRRSVSSNLSDPASPTIEKSPAPPPYQDFASLLNTPAPIIFSTPQERNLLTGLSALGFDTAQIVHSVLSNACDAAGAVWWMLKRKAEKKTIDAGEASLTGNTPERSPRSLSHQEDSKRGVSVQTDIVAVHSPTLSATRSAPQLAFVPPTPTFERPETPPKSRSPTQPFLSPSPTPRSHPSTPVGSLRDKDGSKGRRDGKVRSGSVSIMQRATTALEAAGLVRKKSSEGVRDDREREKSKESDRRMASGEEPRSSHGSSSSKLSRSTYSRPAPSTPPPEPQQPQTQMGSPWVMTEAHQSPLNAPAPTPANSPGDSTQSHSGHPDNAAKSTGSRNRASLLTTFRLWFNDDRKGKRKDPNLSPPGGGSSGSRGLVYNRLNPGNGSVKRRTSGSAGNFASRKVGHRAQRPSVSSHRSSSANSRRSSAASAQIIILDPPHIIEQLPVRRSIGNHTPNSERGDFSSRPSSVRSLSAQRHRKSPSASSAGSAHLRTASPMQKYHKRTGSGSSTRVVRQSQPTPNPGVRHARSNSASSSLHTPSSSRPTSFYDPSESDVPRTVSPFKTPTRRSLDDGRRSSYGSSTTFVAQKRQAPFMMSPGSHLHGNTVGRSSWKKSWGLEPPGWQSRTTHLPIEVLAISPPTDGQIGIRDVFSGRQSLNLGDESDWVDEDEDVPAFAGGLGQMASWLPNSSSGQQVPESTVQLSPAPSGRRAAKRSNRTVTVPTISANRQKPGHSPVERASPIPAENTYEASEIRGGRRQLPPGRSGPAFRHAIQEEDEGEEE